MGGCPPGGGSGGLNPGGSGCGFSAGSGGSATLPDPPPEVDEAPPARAIGSPTPPDQDNLGEAESGVFPPPALRIAPENRPIAIPTPIPAAPVTTNTKADSVVLRPPRGPDVGHVLLGAETTEPAQSATWNATGVDPPKLARGPCPPRDAPANRNADNIAAAARTVSRSHRSIGNPGRPRRNERGFHINSFPSGSGRGLPGRFNKNCTQGAGSSLTPHYTNFKKKQRTL